jgi:hypothetical protein
LVQLIISDCDFLAAQNSTVSSKIDDIKSKIKAVTKNNALILCELDYLFDQRSINSKPLFEKVSIVDQMETSQSSFPKVSSFISKQDSSSNLCSYMVNETVSEVNDDEKISTNEFIDLTNELQTENGTKKCTCKCHSLIKENVKENPSKQSNFLESHLQDEMTIDSANKNYLSHINHCLLCSLKIIKGQLCIKCEGKRAILLNYKNWNDFIIQN